MKVIIQYLYVTLLLVFSVHTATAQQRILTIGDSTMANYDEVKNSGSKEKRGWGQMLPLFFNNEVTFDNAAKNGRSSKSFYYEFWGKLKETLNPGDYVVIQFGHNDEKNNGQDTPETNTRERGTAPWGQYIKYLKSYVNESRLKGAIPILVTPVVRRAFNSDGTTLTEVAKHNLVDNVEIKNDSIMNYVLAMKSVARELSVPLIDMTKLTENMVISFGIDKSKQIIYCFDDNTHLSAMGGVLFSDLFVKELERKNILTEYISYPSGITYSPQNLDFSSCLIGTSPVKAFSILRINPPSKKDIVHIETQKPLSISFYPDSAFKKKLVLEASHDFHRTIFVRFIPSNEENIKQSISLNINGKKQEIAVSGIGVSANKDKIVAIGIFPSKWKSITDSNIEAIGNISANFSLEGLEFNPQANKPSTITIKGKKWEEKEIDMNSARYIEVEIKAHDDIYINNISFNIQAIGNDKMQFTALGYKDKNRKKTDDYAVMESMNNKTTQTFMFNTMLTITKGESYLFRIYPWNKEAGENNYILLDNLRFNGLNVK